MIYSAIRGFTSIELKSYHKSRFTLYWLPVIVYCAAIFIKSSFPTSQRIPDWRNIDKMLHMAAYAILGALFFRALATGRFSNSLKIAAILSILFSSLYGVSDEIHQAFVPGRSPEAADTLANFAGSVLGSCVGWFRFKQKRPPS